MTTLREKTRLCDVCQQPFRGASWASAGLVCDRCFHHQPKASRTVPRRNGPRPDGVSPVTFARSDCGNAELLAHLYGDRLRYDWRRGRWLAWSDHWWTEEVAGLLADLGKQAARHRYLSAPALPSDEEQKREANWALASENHGRLQDAWWAARSEKPFSDKGDDWDPDPFLMGVANGVLDLRDGTLRPGRQADRITTHTDIAFDTTATCPRWLRFLDEVFNGDADLIEFVQRAVGYSCTADTSEQVLFLAYGTGANGKDVFHSTIRAVTGGYSYNAPFSTFEFYARAAIPNDVAALAGRRLVTAAETAEGTRLNEARIKALTGCDVMTARFLHGEFFQFRPVAKYWLACNHRPVVKDDSYAFWRRIRLIPFTRTFKDDADAHLTEKLTAELPGILGWATEGCIRWQVDGLRPPAAVLAATREYETESDPVAGFIEDRCTLGDEYTAKAGRLYTAYRAWAEEQGVQGKEMLTAQAFGRKMAARFTRADTRAARGWQGIGLLADGNA